jgi:hypothetical protein
VGVGSDNRTETPKVGGGRSLAGTRRRSRSRLPHADFVALAATGDETTERDSEGTAPCKSLSVNLLKTTEESRIPHVFAATTARRPRRSRSTRRAGRFLPCPPFVPPLKRCHTRTTHNDKQIA